jgi:group I intron endonuclease
VFFNSASLHAYHWAYKLRVKGRESKGVKNMTEIYGYIYKIENLVNGKIYIGQTTLNPIKRKTIHFHELRKEKHGNSHLQHSFNKYGESNFKFIVLNYATNKKTLNQLEINYIKQYNCLNDNNGYNFKSGGSNGKHSLQTREKMSESQKGLRTGEKNPMRSPEAREKLRKARTGTKHSLETRKKMSRTRKGKRIVNINYLKNLRNSKRGRGLFGFTGASLKKSHNFEKRCWQGMIYFKEYRKSLGYFEDPLSCQIIHDFILKEVYGDNMC